MTAASQAPSAMREWFPASELAGLPGLPSSDRHVRRLAMSEHWQSRARTGPGGGVEYHLSSLPAKTQKALEQQASEPPAVREQRTLEQLSDYKRKRIQARLEVLQALEAWLATQHVTARRRGMEAFCGEYNAGRVTVAHSTRDEIPHVDIATLYRWEQRRAQLGPVGLADNYGKRAGQTTFAKSDALRDFMLGQIRINPDISPTHLWDLLKTMHPDDAAKTSLRSIQRMLKTWKGENPSLFERIVNPDAWRGKRMIALGSRSENILSLNQRWQMDSTPADVLLTDGRHSIIGVIDVYSRRLMYLVSKTSKASAIALLFRRAVKAWGLPLYVDTDNGQDYRSVAFTQALHDLEITQEFARPYHGEDKPHIERSFRTFLHGWLELQPGFIGHNVAERKAIESRKTLREQRADPDNVIEVKLSSSDLQRYCDEWCKFVYERTPHSGLNGRTPFEVASSWTEPVRKPSNDRALDMLLAPIAGTRTIRKKGIPYGNALFIAPELGGRSGECVQLREDPEDWGRLVVYTAEGSFLCVAECPERTGISRREVAMAAHKIERETMKRQLGELNEARRRVRQEMQGKSPAEILMDAAREQEATVTALPRPAEKVTTPALDESNKAAEALAALPAPVASIDRARVSRAKAEAADEDLRWKDQQWDRFKGLEVRQGEALSEEDRSWMQWFETTPTYRSRKMLEEAATAAPVTTRRS